MSHGSLKDTVKAVQIAFANDAAPTIPLPDELQQTIEAFLDLHQNIDDHDSQRLHDELVSIRNRPSSTSSERLGAFVHVLRLLRPCIRGDRRLGEWWLNVIKPIIDSVGHKRDTIEDAREFLLGILVFDADDDTTGENANLSARFTRRILETYLVRTKIPTTDEEVVSPEDEYIAQELEGILVAFGRKKPKELLVAIDEQLVQRDRRLQALSLLSSFVRLQPAHLHLVLDTQVIHHLHNCLLIDTGGTVVDLALTNLIMFLPHITSSLAACLPKLFVIYARILCWDQYARKPDSQSEKDNQAENPSDVDINSALEFDASWQVVERSFDSLEVMTPKANYLFTFLYGLFPLNFMAFIRKPRRYLKMKSFLGADDLPLYQDMIRRRSEIHRVVHKLHPNFMNTTPEDELTDNRLLKIDAADLVSECLGLCIAVANSLGDPGPPPTSKLPPIPKTPRSHKSRPDALLSPSPDDDQLTSGAPSPTTEFRSHMGSWRHTQSTTITAPSTGHLIDPVCMPPRKSSQYDLGSQDASPGAEGSSPPKEGLVSRHQSFKPRLQISHSSFEDAVTSNVSRLQTFAQGLSRSPISQPNSPGTDTYNTAILQREVMILKNDLNFERFQKAQYVAQIGQLQRKHIKEATSESQAQSTLNTNRTLQEKLKKADVQYAQFQKETALNRGQAKRFEEQLTQKVKTFREEEKRWHAGAQALRHDLQKALEECGRLEKIVVESESKYGESQHRLTTLTVDLEEMASLRKTCQDLEARLREYELRELEADRTKEDHELLRSELQSVKLNLDSRDAELERTKKTSEQKISMLENRLRDAQQGSIQPGQLSPTVQQMMDSAMAASQSKMLALKRNYKSLQDKHVDLEIRYQELEAGRSSNSPGLRPSSVLSLTSYADDSMKGPYVTSGRDSSSTNLSRICSARRPHAFSDPSLLDDDDEDAQYNSAHGGDYRYPVRPQRFESFAGMRPIRERGTSPPRLANNEHNHDFHSTFSFRGNQAHDAPASSVKGITQTGARIYGRGGASRKLLPKESKEKKDKPSKTGGFRGLKHIM
ncbi:hypothetical protein E6O75_ATG03786 [Venturia nashicola]|uniref:Uncharacterized protein n=1 Tax=Venturia nashicola TaxID=86259 RepID=A0A4Z1P9M2_9PEZI|nr:hypothetical protein E6O75_ATG03786 [Venturia nashicola]